MRTRAHTHTCVHAHTHTCVHAHTHTSQKSQAKPLFAASSGEQHNTWFLCTPSTRQIPLAHAHLHHICCLSNTKYPSAHLSLSALCALFSAIDEGNETHAQMQQMVAPATSCTAAHLGLLVLPLHVFDEVVKQLLRPAALSVAFHLSRRTRNTKCDFRLIVL